MFVLSCGYLFRCLRKFFLLISIYPQCSTGGWMVWTLTFWMDGRGFNPISGLSFDFQKLSSYSGLDVLGLHTPEPTHQSPRSGSPQVSLLAVDVVGGDIIVISVRLRATILGATRKYSSSIVKCLCFIVCLVCFVVWCVSTLCGGSHLRLANVEPSRLEARWGTCASLTSWGYM